MLLPGLPLRIIREILLNLSSGLILLLGCPLHIIHKILQFINRVGAAMWSSSPHHAEDPWPWHYRVPPIKPYRIDVRPYCSYLYLKRLSICFSQTLICHATTNGSEVTWFVIFYVLIFASSVLLYFTFESISIPIQWSPLKPCSKYSISDLIWFDLIWFDLIWIELIWIDLNWFELIWFDLIWFDLIWFDLIWFDLIWFYFILFYFILFYFILFYLIWFGLIWLDLIWFGLFFTFFILFVLIFVVSFFLVFWLNKPCQDICWCSILFIFSLNDCHQDIHCCSFLYFLWMNIVKIFIAVPFFSFPGMKIVNSFFYSSYSFSSSSEQSLSNPLFILFNFFSLHV